MRQLIPALLLCTSVVLVAPFASARETRPDAVLDAVAAEAMCIATKDGETAAARQAKIAGLIETESLPSFDFPRMTELALARNWHLASALQQATLITEFRRLLLGRHSAALSSKRKRVIEFKRLRAAAGDTEARVKSEAKQAGRENLRIAYEMRMTPAGWKVYDVSVDGASLIAIYRESFTRAVRDAGIEGLIKLLYDNNRQADSGAEPGKTTHRDHALIMFAMLQTAFRGRR